MKQNVGKPDCQQMSCKRHSGESAVPNLGKTSTFMEVVFFSFLSYLLKDNSSVPLDGFRLP